MTSVNEFHERSPRGMIGQNIDITSLQGVEGIKTKNVRKYPISHRENLNVGKSHWVTGGPESRKISYTVTSPPKNSGLLLETSGADMFFSFVIPLFHI